MAETPSISVYLGADGMLELYDFAMSCAGTEIDWEVYEGTLGDFHSHVPVLCTTGWSWWTAPFTPRPGDTYYLVVPRSLDFEGSYGKTSSGAERPPSIGACRPQSILACP